MLFDIYIGMPKKASTYKNYVLPADFLEMKNFIENNKVQMTEQVVSSIEYALEKKLSFVEVFSFKNSDFVITLPLENFKENLENVYNYYIETERYELCTRVKSVETKLINVLNKKTAHEKKQTNKTKQSWIR
jgi:hypothetical protein